MQKKVFAIIVMLTMLVGLFAVGVSANTTSELYEVGYAIKDINPYIYSDALGMGVKDLGELANDPEWTVEVEVENPATEATTTERMIRVPLAGYANSAERPSSGIMDDNGDNYTGIGDGLHITCTTVTDHLGTTLVYFTVDAISGYDNLLNDAAAEVATKLGSTVEKENVFVNGSHTHEGADLGAVKGPSGDDAQYLVRNQLWNAYYRYVIDCMVEAAEECYENKTKATMSKGFISASDSSGYQLNFVRQYKVDEYTFFGSVLSKTYVFGSGFGEQVLPSNDFFEKRTVNNVSEADDTMHILQFVPTNGDKPIVLINWRAHGTMMSPYSGESNGAIISADYISSFRYAMEKAGYRMAFLQGAAGNIVATHALSGITKNGVTNKGYTPWVDDMPVGTNHAIYYGGTLLKNVAVDCLQNKMKEVAPGAIHSIQTKLDLKMQEDPAGLIAAAIDYQNKGLTSSNYKYTYSEDGKVYIINSQHHARNVVNRSKTSDPDSYADIVLNAFMLGESVAFVTAPSELFDRYSLDATLTDTSDNDWNDLVKEIAYGTPFVMAYTNGHNGYTANNLSFSYNKDSNEFGVGSYEANSSRNAAGEGEKIIKKYGEMLTILSEGYKNGPCQHCQEANVEWTPLTKQDFDSSANSLASGHYYLYENVSRPSHENEIDINGAKVCFDLNGKTLETCGRAFSVTGGGILSIVDSAEGGCVISSSWGNSVGGGVISTGYNAKAEVNLYGGTLMHTGNNSHVSKGGILSVNYANTFNMYGGVVDASDCILVKDTGDYVSGNTDGCGAAIAVYPGATINISGGRVIAGTAEPEAGRADCILVQDKTSKVTLSGDAQIDEIYFDALCPENFKISGAYTGTATLQFNQANIALEDRMDIGNNENADLSEAELTFGTDSNYYVVVSDADLLLTNASAAVCGSDGIFQYYDSLGKAVSAYSVSAKYIQLCRDVPVDVTIDKNIYLDLNGYDITGKLSVNEGCILYCMDSRTDDYTIEDKYGYGKLTNVSGTIKGVPEESAVADDGYLKITENGAVSFHRVNLDLTHMTLRAVQSDGEPSPGVYYKSNFMGDEKVANAITQYGVALSVQEMPNEKNLETKSKYSSYQNGGKTIFKPGQVGNSGNGTLLKGIMKPNNAYLINLRNSHIDIYGRAYILTEEGYMFGGGHKRTLKQQTEATDTLWASCDDDKKQALSTMYNTYKNIMDSWNIPNISGKYDVDADGTMRILGIGNSYTMDCMWMLGKVYATENPGKKIQLGIAYYSGASLAQHVDFITNKNNVYTYYYLDDVDGTWKDEQNVTLEYIIGAKKWDMVSMQQGSTDASTQATYNGDIQTIQNHVIDTLNYKPLFFWNMTWAYPVCKERPNYTLDHQMNIYYSIVNAVKKKIIPDETFEFVTPVGVAVQNANTVLDDTDLYFDNTHINAYSRIMAAYTWYCQLENVNANLLTELKVTTTPEAFNKLHGNGQQVNHSDEYMLIALEAVRNALITGRAGTFALTDLTSAQ